MLVCYFAGLSEVEIFEPIDLSILNPKFHLRLDFLYVKSPFIIAVLKDRLFMEEFPATVFKPLMYTLYYFSHWLEIFTSFYCCVGNTIET